MLELLPGSPGAPLRVLCLGAHCDDVEIGCGGTLLRLLESRPGSSVRWAVFASTPERERETRACARELLSCAAGSQLTVAAFRESYFPYVGAEIKDAFFALQREAEPDLVLTHRLDDRHQDHRTIAELTWNTFRRQLVLEYEVAKYEGDLGQPNLYVPLPEPLARRKVELLLKHYRSQAGKPWFQAAAFEALMRLRAIECRAESGWAEAFHARKAVVRP
jgi:LmbE family N-acetylglucosaminyl deacetylase